MSAGRWQDAPGRAERGCYVYVVAFDNKMVKVGYTKNARSRFVAYTKDVRASGAALADFWVSPAHAEWRWNEQALIRLALALGGEQAGLEYFSGVDFATLADMARDLPFSPPGTTGSRIAYRPPDWLTLTYVFPDIPARMRVAPTRWALVASMDAVQLDHARNMLLARTQNAMDGAKEAAEHERKVFAAFYNRVRPLLTDGLTVSDVLERLAEKAA